MMRLIIIIKINIIYISAIYIIINFKTGNKVEKGNEVNKLMKYK